MPDEKPFDNSGMGGDVNAADRSGSAVIMVKITAL